MALYCQPIHGCGPGTSLTLYICCSDIEATSLFRNPADDAFGAILSQVGALPDESGLLQVPTARTTWHLLGTLSGYRVDCLQQQREASSLCLCLSKGVQPSRSSFLLSAYLCGRCPSAGLAACKSWVPAYTGRVKSIPAFEPWAKVAGARVLGQDTSTKVRFVQADVCTSIP